VSRSSVSESRTSHGAARLDDVEAKLADTEKEADKARKDSKSARDQFNDVKRRRYVLIHSPCSSTSDLSLEVASYSTKRTTTFLSALIKYTKT
jgi:hypothetical protein